MSKNEIWQLDYKWARCHTENGPQKTRLLAMKDSRLANAYFYEGRRFAWDVDVPMSRVGVAEAMLGAQCDTSDASIDRSGVPIRERIEGVGRQMAALSGDYDVVPLPEHYADEGVQYDMVVRSGIAAIFEATLPGTDCPPWYDLVAPRRRKIKGAGYKEVRPSNEDWGLRAWSFDTLEHAQEAT